MKWSDRREEVLLIVLLALLLMPGLLASPLDKATYLTVIASNKGADLVVDAANFAVGMEVDGYTFTGTTLDTLRSKDVEKKFLVVFKKGKKAVIADGLNDNHAVMLAKELLEDQGYTVELSVPSEVLPRATEAVNTTAEPNAEPDETRTAEERSPVKCDGCAYGDQCLAVGTRTTDEYCSSTHAMEHFKEQNETCIYNYECRSNDCRGTCYEEPAVKREPQSTTKKSTPGIITRFFRWLTSFFS